ncbi:UMP-CMP kinase 2, mitochondrial isoform X2 [Leuresthes tenuis]|uniref:UMP-CMP kinase 2, mitochondrial isoform X2 n=1 Tax=Leuresthes tenuis TaxID=355514 RepID=UPI003B50B598
MAKNVKSLLSRWSSRVFLLELDGATQYFGIQKNNWGKVKVPRPFSAFQEEDRCYSVLVCSPDRIKKAKFYGELKDILLRKLPPGCDFAVFSSFLPNVQDSLIKGYFLKSSIKENSSLIERLLSDLEQHDPVLVCSYSGSEDGQWTQRLWSRAESELGQMTEAHNVVPAEEPTYHPSTLNIKNSDVFYSFDEACDVLKKCGDIIPEAKSVLEMLPSRVEAIRKPDFPVVVIEGLDATGKTTLTESLRDTLGATLLRSPPECLAPWRARFDQEPPIIRRAFYALGNYITAEQISQEGMKTPIIVDRFWHSTAAYAIATAVNGPVSNLPSTGSEVYIWPSDLLQPSLVVLLTLAPEERKRRLRNRGQKETDEEKELDHNRLFRLRGNSRQTGRESTFDVSSGPRWSYSSVAGR